MQQADSTQKLVEWSTRLKAGDSGFEVTVKPNMFDRGQTDLDLEVLFADLRPDYFSATAAALDMDSEQEKSSPVTFEVAPRVAVLDSAYFGGRPLAFLNASLNVIAVLDLINGFSEQIKPKEAVTSPLYIDWVSEFYGDDPPSDGDVVAYHEARVEEWYQERYVEATHKRPSKLFSWRDVPGMNPFAFPTNPDMVGGVYLRFHIAPNVTFTMPGPKLAAQFGFAEDRLPPKVRNQQAFANPSGDSVRVLQCEGSPADVFTGLANNRMYFYYTRAHPDLPKVAVRTTKAKEWDYADLAGKINAALSRSLTRHNFNLSAAHYTEETGMFDFNLPARPSVEVTLGVPPWLSRRLGHGPGGTIVANPTGQTPAERRPSAGTSEVSSKQAETLAMDVGMIMLACDRAVATNACHFGNSVVACLRPAWPGQWSTGVGANPVRRPMRVHCLEPDMTFALYRFGEDGSPAPLEFKRDCYLQLALAAHK